MKIFFGFLILLATISPFFAFQNEDILCRVDAKEIVFVTEKNGKQYFEKGDVNQNNISKLNSSLGVVLKSNLNLSQLTENLDLEIIKEENIENNHIIYAYTPYFSKKIKIENKQSNVQIVEKEGYVLIGMPIIYSGF